MIPSPTTMNTHLRSSPWQRLTGLAVLALGFLFATPANASSAGALPAPAPQEEETGAHGNWSDETIELFSSLPVQHGGRIKPLGQFAALHLLTFNGKRKLELDEDTKITASEWLLDCLFFPDVARTYPCFRVDYSAVVSSLGLPIKERFDWYSYEELLPGRHKLDQEANRILEIEGPDRSPLQRQTLKLANDLYRFESLLSTLEPFRRTFSTTGSAELDELYGREESNLTELLVEAPALNSLVRGTLDQETAEFEAMRKVFSELDSALRFAQGTPDFLPPVGELAPEGELDEWLNVADLVMASFNSELDFERYQGVLGNLQRLEEVKSQPAEFQSELAGLHENLVTMAMNRGAYEQIPLELQLYKIDPFTKALVFFILAFVLLAFGWLAPNNKWILRGIWGSVGLGVALVVMGITMRCIIRSRPPVVSLYDTILFITGSMVLVTMFLERLTRQRIALGVGAVLGAGGMFLAMRYELKEIESSGDTMASVVAVLDTNYYLAIHVTTITLGYAGGLLAGALAHVWILGQLFGYKAGDKAFYKGLTRMIYGIICFCLLFSIFGTIMGGVWANDSWGRFWGWDPKENGALLICIWGLLILHMRMGGYIRDRGLAVMAVIGGMVVSASWWGVNLLNVGLHSYGFTSGVGIALLTAWGIEMLVIGLSMLDVILRKTRGVPA